jgi:hypothetical protein
MAADGRQPRRFGAWRRRRETAVGGRTSYVLLATLLVATEPEASPERFVAIDDGGVSGAESRQGRL